MLYNLQNKIFWAQNTIKIKRKVRRIHWYTAENEKTNDSEVIKVKRTVFLISLIILSDLSTIKFRLLKLHFNLQNKIFWAQNNIKMNRKARRIHCHAAANKETNDTKAIKEQDII